MEKRTIRLIDPLPCSIIRGLDRDDARCGQPAYAAHAISADALPAYQQVGLMRSEWILMPICRECAKAGSALYPDGEEE